MFKTMFRNTFFMVIASAFLAAFLFLYINTTRSVALGEAGSGNGIFTSTAKGFLSDVTVTITLRDGELTAAEIDASGETPELGGRAAQTLLDTLVETGSLDGVDAIAGATITSDAVFAATADCFTQAGGAGESGAGAGYTATAKGFLSDVTVNAEISDGVITSLTIDASGETPEYGGNAAETLTATILEAGTSEGVDAVAGATMTSNAVLAAVADCEAQAG